MQLCKYYHKTFSELRIGLIFVKIITDYQYLLIISLTLLRNVDK